MIPLPMLSLPKISLVLVLCIFSSHSWPTDLIVESDRQNGIYEWKPGDGFRDRSNGNGTYCLIASGPDDPNMDNDRRIARALIHFDLDYLLHSDSSNTPSSPSSSTFQKIVLELSLFLNKSVQIKPNSDYANYSFQIYSIPEEWGSGSSNAGTTLTTLRSGVRATEGDATWRFPFYSFNHTNLHYWTGDSFGVIGGPKHEFPDPIATHIIRLDSKINSNDNSAVTINIEIPLSALVSSPNGFLIKGSIEQTNQDLYFVIGGARARPTERPRLRITYDGPIPMLVLLVGIGSTILFIIITAVFIIIIWKRGRAHRYKSIDNLKIKNLDVKQYLSLFKTKNISIYNHRNVHIKGIIGKGSFGSVYGGLLVRSKSDLGINVAIKKINLDHLSKAQDQSLEMNLLIDEIYILNVLTHPNVVRFIGIAFDESSVGSIGIITELAEKGSLFKVLHRDQHRFTYQEKIELLLQIAYGMHYLHSQKPRIIHRDLKSDNVLITNDYIAKLCDFGLSRAVDASFNDTIRPVGTPYYVAPEALTTHRYSEQTDVYSYGVITIELYTNSHPRKIISDYTQKSEETIRVGGVLLSEIQYPIPSRCPDPIRTILKKSLSAEPHERGSFQEIIRLLEAKSITRPGPSLSEDKEASLSTISEITEEEFDSLVRDERPSKIGSEYEVYNSAPPELMSPVSLDYFSQPTYPHSDGQISDLYLDDEEINVLPMQELVPTSRRDQND